MTVSATLLRTQVQLRAITLTAALVKTHVPLPATSDKMARRTQSPVSSACTHDTPEHVGGRQNSSHGLPTLTNVLRSRNI
jgi:hypothetical protein